MFAIQKVLKNQIVIIMEDNDGNGRLIIGNELYRKAHICNTDFTKRFRTIGWVNCTNLSVVASGNYRGYTKKVDWLKHDFHDSFFESDFFSDWTNDGKLKSLLTMENEILSMF